MKIVTLYTTDSAVTANSFVVRSCKDIASGHIRTLSVGTLIEVGAMEDMLHSTGQGPLGFCGIDSSRVKRFIPLPCARLFESFKSAMSIGLYGSLTSKDPRVPASVMQPFSHRGPS